MKKQMDGPVEKFVEFKQKNKYNEELVRVTVHMRIRICEESKAQGRSQESFVFCHLGLLLMLETESRSEHKIITFLAPVFAAQTGC